jgi:hypothetical protein
MPFGNPELWRERAKEARVRADQMHVDPGAKNAMLGVAESYEKIAAQYEDIKQASYPNSATTSRATETPSVVAKKWAEDAREIVLNMQLNDNQLEASKVLAAMGALANAIIALAGSKQ